MAGATPSNDPIEKLTRQLEQETNDSIALLRDIQSNPICSISFDESIPGLLVQWKSYATSTQLRFIHERIIQMLKQHNIRKILADDDALPTVHADDQKWIADNWLPRAKAAGLRAIGAKKPAAYFGKLSVGKLQSALSPELTVQSFDELDPARQWLRSVEV